MKHYIELISCFPLQTCQQRKDLKESFSFKITFCMIINTYLTSGPSF